MTNLDAALNRPQRGALLVTVTPSTSTLSAGRRFSIAVNITNPYEVPVSIGNVSTQTPFEIFDVLYVEGVAEQRRALKQIEDLRLRLLHQLGLKAIPRTYRRENTWRA